MRFKGFIGPSYTLRSVNVDCQRCVNMFLEKNELGTGKEGEMYALLPTPGLTTLVTLAGGVVRGTFTASNGTLYAVGGNKLYSVDSSWTATELGTLATNTGVVKMEDNGLQLFIVDGANGYYWTFGNTYTAQVDTVVVNSLSSVPGHVFGFSINGTAISYTSVLGDSYFSILTGLNNSMLANGVESIGMVSGVGTGATLTITANNAGSANTYASVDSQLTQANIVPNGSTGPSFTQVSDPAWNGADIVTFQDGYLIFNRPATNQFYLSGLVNAALGLTTITFDGLDFGELLGSSDTLVGHISCNRQLWLFGEKATEIWYNSGASGFPFAPISGATMQIGCAAKFSIARLGNTVYWVGRAEEGEGIVYMANGYVPQRISTHAVEEAITGYGDISNATSYCYQEEGHGFYVLNFPSANTTWVYDGATQSWHERAYTASGQLQRHRADSHAYAYGVHVVGDYATGQLYQSSTEVFSDDASAITRLRASPHVTADLKRLFYSQFQLDCQVGVGIDGSGQGVDPQVMLDFSDDGGHSWSNEKWASLGPIGSRKKRVIWRRLGKSRDRVFRVKITDPVFFILIGAEIDIEKAVS